MNSRLQESSGSSSRSDRGRVTHRWPGSSSLFDYHGDRVRVLAALASRRTNRRRPGDSDPRMLSRSASLTRTFDTLTLEVARTRAASDRDSRGPTGPPSGTGHDSAGCSEGLTGRWTVNQKNRPFPADQWTTTQPNGS